MTVQTWTWDADLASWRYRLLVGGTEEARALADPAARSPWLAARMLALTRLLEDFATPARAEVDTESGGEDAFTVDLEGQPIEALTDFLSKAPDVRTVQVFLTLRCLGEKSAELLLEEAGALTLFVELDNEGRFDVERGSPVWLVLSLDCDIYAPITRAARSDNRELAALNGPRLARFLERLERLLPAEFLGVDAQSYRGVAHRYGFSI